jgi:hypothetical protein
MQYRLHCPASSLPHFSIRTVGFESYFFVKLACLSLRVLVIVVAQK